MRTLLNKGVFAAVLAIAIPLAHANQGSFTNSGGSGSGGAGISVGSPVANPAGNLSLTCPPSSPAHCAGGSLTYFSNDGTTAINASFTDGTYAESCSGGGKGGHITCGWSLTANFSGTLTLNGVSQAIIGVTSQAFGTTNPTAYGTTAYNSAYAPFYYSDSEQLHRSDDLQGTNQISCCTQGQLYGANAIALDTAGRIYVADTYNCRVVRIDDMTGTNWTTYGGTCGSAQGQFYDPQGIAVDPAGKIYVMDTGNGRLVRIDDMTGANWVVYGSVGSGTGQFSATTVTVDAGAHIYIPDSGNARIIRVDDMTGANWTVLNASPVVNGVSHSFQSPAAIAVDSAGRIYIADDGAPQPAVIRVDDMTGANWTSIYTGAGSGLNSISVDSGGTVFTGGGGAKWIDGMSAVLNSSGSVGPIGSYYVFGVTAVPLPSPRPSAVSFSPSTLDFSVNVGASGSLPVTIANFGGSPLNLGSISANGGFGETNTCPSQLLAGSNCTVNVTFAPAVMGTWNGALNVTDDSGNLGAAQSVTLTGVGLAPAATVSPATLSFPSQVVNTTSVSKTVTLQSAGTGPLQVTSVTVSGPFDKNDNCVGTVVAGASCTITVWFTPEDIGTATGSVTIIDNAGTQSVPLSGTAVAPVALSSAALNLGTAVVGSTSPARSVTLTNHRSAALSFTSIVASTGFAVVGNTCGTGIAGGSSCTVGVTFTPTAVGAANGALTFTDSAANSPQKVSLSGTGEAPVTLSTGTLNFGNVAVGATSSAKTVTVTNHQSSSLSFTHIVASAGFTISGNTCGAKIGAGASCTVDVKFSPTATGAVAGKLTLTDSAANSPQTVTLTGTGK